MKRFSNTFLGKEQILADKLHSAAVRILRRIRLADEASGLSPARLSALSVLVFGGPQKLGNLAKNEGVKPPTMTRLVQAMERDGLVTRIPDLSDRRITYIAPTDKGVKLMNDARLRRVNALAGLLSPLDDHQQKTLADAVEILETLLKKKKKGANGKPMRSHFPNKK